MKDNNFNLKGYNRSRCFQNTTYKIFLSENVSTQSQTPAFQMMLSFTRHDYHFSLTISPTTAIKTKNIAFVIPSIIHKTQQLNIQSSGLKPAKLL